MDRAYAAVRWSPYWHASTGCLDRGPGGMLRLQTPSAATVRLDFDVTVRGLLDAFVGARPTCTKS